MHKLVVLASGSGSNFQAIIDAIHRGDIDAQIVGLITNKSEIGAIERAEKNSIPVKVVSPSDPTHFNQNLLNTLLEWNPDLIVLAGFLKKIPDKVIEAFSGKIINIHPSLLPKYGGKGFYGKRVHQAVINAKETESGCTVHLVDEKYDTGAIIEQVVVPILPTDDAETLAKKVLKQEHKLLPKIINKILTEKYS
ncbi:MAG: phosphoribosylglycinamide formyltransferase [Balneolaceae bacterium]